jgi:hypothetical protein
MMKLDFCVSAKQRGVSKSFTLERIANWKPEKTGEIPPVVWSLLPIFAAHDE